MTTTPEAEPLGHDEIRLHRRVFKLSKPSSYTMRHEIVMSGGKNLQRAIGAAIGVTTTVHKQWKQGDARPPTYEGCDFNPLRYGGEMFDWLLAKGVPASDIWVAGTAAFTLLSESLVSATDIERAEGNSEQKEDG